MVVQQGIVLQRTTLATGVTSSAVVDGRNTSVPGCVAVTTLVHGGTVHYQLVIVIMHVLGMADWISCRSQLTMVDLFTRVVKQLLYVLTAFTHALLEARIRRWY